MGHEEVFQCDALVPPFKRVPVPGILRVAELLPEQVVKRRQVDIAKPGVPFIHRAQCNICLFWMIGKQEANGQHISLPG